MLKPSVALVAALVLWVSLGGGTPAARAGDSPPAESAAEVAQADELAERLGASNKLDVAEAITLLGRMRTPTAGRHLMDFVKKSKNAQWAAEAVTALGWSGNEAAVDFLCGKYGVRSRKLLVAEAACQSLAKIGDKRAIPTLFEAIRGKKIVVTRAAILAVVELDRAADGMAKLMVDLSRHKSSQVREVVAQAMGRLADKSVVEPLIVMATKDGNSIVRLEACKALGDQGAVKARPALEKVAQDDKSADVRRAAAAALVRIPATPEEQ